MPLEDVVIEKSVSYGAVCHFWGGWLGVSHLYERHGHRCASLKVEKKGSMFGFHCAGKDVSRGHAFVMNWSIERRFLWRGVFSILYPPAVLFATVSDRNEASLWMWRIIPLA